MATRAAVLALSAVFLTGLVTAAQGAVGNETPAAPAPSASDTQPPPLEQINSDGVVLATESPFSDLWGGRVATPASGFVLLDRPCEHFPGPAMLLPPSDGVPALDEDYAKGGVDQGGTQVEIARRPAGSLTPPSYCAAVVTVDHVAKTAPASGVLVLKVAAASPKAPSPDPVVSWIKYSVTRTSGPDTYVWVFGIALFLGLLVGAQVLNRLAALPAEKILPEIYDYKDPWASAVALLGAIGTPLLAQTGALAAFAPQYDTAGITIANIVVAALLAAGPVIVAAFYRRADESNFAHDGPQWRRCGVLAVVGALVLTALSAQLLLDLVYILAAGLGDGVLEVASCLAAIVWFVLAWFVVSTIRRDIPVARPVEAPPGLIRDVPFWKRPRWPRLRRRTQS